MKAKSLLQVIIIFQAATVVLFAWRVAPVFADMFDHWGPAAIHGGTTTALWLLFGLAAKIIVPFALCCAVLWWLKQQRAVVDSLDPNSQLVSRRTITIAVATASFLCALGFAAFRMLTPKPAPPPSPASVTTPAPVPDLVKEYEDSHK